MRSTSLCFGSIMLIAYPLSIVIFSGSVWATGTSFLEALPLPTRHLSHPAIRTDEKEHEEHVQNFTPTVDHWHTLKNNIGPLITILSIVKSQDSLVLQEVIESLLKKLHRGESPDLNEAQALLEMLRREIPKVLEDSNQLEDWIELCIEAFDATEEELHRLKGEEEPIAHLDLRRFMKEVHHHWQPLFAAHGIRLDLHPFDEIQLSLIIDVERAELRSALDNLLDNAHSMMVKARENPANENNLPSHCYLGVLQESTRDERENHVLLRFLVEDDGPGLSPLVKRKAKKGKQVSDREDGQGTGIGLASVRSFAVRHGGELSLDDRGPDERGAIVSFKVNVPFSRIDLL